MGFKRSHRIVMAAFAFAMLFLLAQAGAVSAGPAAPGDRPFTQPDGSTVIVRAYGDEWQHGLETTGGHAVLVDKASGFLVYAETQADGSLAPAQVDGKMLVVGQDAPGALALHARPASVQQPAQAQQRGQAQGEILMGQNVGAMDVVVLLVYFNNMSYTYPPSEFQSMFFGAGKSIKDFYQKASFGKLNLAPAAESYGTPNDGVVGWIKLTMNHPDPDQSAISAASWSIARAALTAADPYIIYANYDDDGDGYVTSKELQVVIIAAGNEASYCDECSPMIWAHQYDLEGYPLMLEGKQVGQHGADGDYGGYVIAGERHSITSLPSSTTHRAQMGTLAHEFGHLLAWPDLYDVSGYTAGVGNWSVMGGGSWNGLTLQGDTPALPDAWSKLYQGWISPANARNGTQNLLRSASAYPDVVRLGFNPGGVDWDFYKKSGVGEYWLVENRQYSGYDQALPGCGLLFWHIKENVTYSNSANTWAAGPLVSLEQADGYNQLNNSPYDRGDEGDPFPGDAGILAFNNFTDPGSRYHDGSSSTFAVTITDPDGASGVNCASTMRMAFISSVVLKNNFIPLLVR